MLSVNQTMTQIKLTEMWKARSTNQNPLNITPRTTPEGARTTRSVTNEALSNTGFSEISKKPLSLKTQKECGMEHQ